MVILQLGIGKKRRRVNTVPIYEPNFKQSIHLQIKLGNDSWQAPQSRS